MRGDSRGGVMCEEECLALYGMSKCKVVITHPHTSSRLLSRYEAGNQCCRSGVICRRGRWNEDAA